LVREGRVVNDEGSHLAPWIHFSDRLFLSTKLGV
jgi:hypothetical protein